MSTLRGELIVTQQRFGIVVSRFNETITTRLRDAAVETLIRQGCTPERITEISVPGAFELPLASRNLALSGQVDAIIALGCVIKGDTPHFDYVCQAASSGLSAVALETGIPIAFGVLTTLTIEQAMERAGVKGNNKGADAALVAIEMCNLMRQIKS